MDFGRSLGLFRLSETIWSCFRASGMLSGQIWSGWTLFAAWTELSNLSRIGGAFLWIWCISRRFDWWNCEKMGAHRETYWRGILSSRGFAWWNCEIIRAPREKCWYAIWHLASWNEITASISAHAIMFAEVTWFLAVYRDVSVRISPHTIFLMTWDHFSWLAQRYPREYSNLLKFLMMWYDFSRFAERYPWEYSHILKLLMMWHDSLRFAERYR